MEYVLKQFPHPWSSAQSSLTWDEEHHRSIIEAHALRELCQPRISPQSRILPCFEELYPYNQTKPPFSIDNVLYFTILCAVWEKADRFIPEKCELFSLLTYGVGCRISTPIPPVVLPMIFWSDEVALRRECHKLAAAMRLIFWNEAPSSNEILDSTLRLAHLLDRKGCVLNMETTLLESIRRIYASGQVVPPPSHGIDHGGPSKPEGDRNQPTSASPGSPAEHARDAPDPPYDSGTPLSDALSDFDNDPGFRGDDPPLSMDTEFSSDNFDDYGLTESAQYVEGPAGLGLETSLVGADGVGNGEEHDPNSGSDGGNEGASQAGSYSDNGSEMLESDGSESSSGDKSDQIPGPVSPFEARNALRSLCEIAQLRGGENAWSAEFTQLPEDSRNAIIGHVTRLQEVASANASLAI
ncbi:hypothetical protein IAU59_007574 [Kwoniella sp. CBS 9459]